MSRHTPLNLRQVTMRMGFFSVLLSVFLAASTGGTAGASPATEALTKEGIALRRAGRDSDAVRKLQAAYDLEATPRAAAQLGLCLQALGRWSEADAKLAEAITAVDDPWIKKNRAVLKESSEAAKTHVGRVEVLGDPAGAVVTISGRNVGRLPLEDAVPVNEGLVDVELSAEGYDNALRSLTITGGSYQRLVVRLSKTPRVANAPLPAAAPPPENTTVMTGVSAEPAEASSTPLLKNPWFWSGVGVVVVAGIVGALVIGSGSKSPAFSDSGAL